jgi:hypothetical protein
MCKCIFLLSSFYDSPNPSLINEHWELGLGINDAQTSVDRGRSFLCLCGDNNSHFVDITFPPQTQNATVTLRRINSASNYNQAEPSETLQYVYAAPRYHVYCEQKIVVRNDYFFKKSRSLAPFF